MEGPDIVNEWLDGIESAGRTLNDVLSALDSLEQMESHGTRPTIGWMVKNTSKGS